MTNGMPPFSLLLWSPLRVSLSAFCTSKRCFQIHPNRFPSCLQTLRANIHIQPFFAAARFPIRIQNPDDRDQPPGFSRFRAFAADFPAKRRACRPLVAGSKPFWLLEYFRIKFYLPFLDSFIGKGTDSKTLWFSPAWGC